MTATAFIPAANAENGAAEDLSANEIKTLATNGFPYYQALLSNCWRRGDYPGIPMEYEAAVKWGKLADASGDPLGRYCMAVMNDNGIGVKADPEAAEKIFTEVFPELLKTADSSGDPEYCYAVGYMYYAGKGVAQDKKTAAVYFTKAAEKSHDLASAKLGAMYCTGDGVEQSLPLAMKWLLPSAQNGNAGSQYLLAILYMKSAAVKNNLHEGARWLKRSADKGNKDAQFLYASLLESKKLGYDNLEQSLEYYHKAALQGHPQAQERLKTFARQMREQLNLPQNPANPSLEVKTDSPKAE